jgi:hypothetical protein
VLGLKFNFGCLGALKFKLQLMLSDRIAAQTKDQTQAFELNLKFITKIDFLKNFSIIFNFNLIH